MPWRFFSPSTRKFRGGSSPETAGETAPQKNLDSFLFPPENLSFSNVPFTILQQKSYICGFASTAYVFYHRGCILSPNIAVGALVIILSKNDPISGYSNFLSWYHLSSDLSSFYPELFSGLHAAFFRYSPNGLGARHSIEYASPYISLTSSCVYFRNMRLAVGVGFHSVTSMKNVISTNM